MSFILWIAAFVAILYFAVNFLASALLFVFQFEQAGKVTKPAEMKKFFEPQDAHSKSLMKTYNPEPLMLQTPDNLTIFAWFFRAKSIPSAVSSFNGDSKKVPTIIFSHGNGGNIGFNGYMWFQLAILMVDTLRCNVCIYDYRGAGISEGKPSEKGLLIDAETILKHVSERDDVDTSRLFAMGVSLGGAVTAALVKNNPGKFRGMIIENSFTSFAEVAQSFLSDRIPLLIRVPQLRSVFRQIVPFISKPLAVLLKVQFNSAQAVSQIKTPSLFFVGEKDEVIPPHMSRTLFESSACPRSEKMLVSIADVGHMDMPINGGPVYWNQLAAFISNNLPEHDSDD